MTDAAEVLDVLSEARSAGLSIAVIDGNLEVKGPAKTRGQWREALKRHKPELVSYLSGQAAAPAESSVSRTDVARHRWTVIQGGGTTEVTVAPAATKEEVQRQYPAAVVEIDHRQPTPPTCLAEATVWASLIGESDPELVAPFASVEGLPALQIMAMRELLRHPPNFIASLTDQEAVDAALAVLEHIQPSESLRRALGPLEVAARARYGDLERRAGHTRAVLALVAADPKIRSRFAPEGA